MTVKNGPLPKGWREVQLGEFMEFKNGLNTRKENYGSGVKFVNVMDVFSHNYLYANDIIGSVQVTKKQLVDYSVKYGDVLFNRTSETIEEIAMSSVYLDKKEIIFGGFVIRGRPKSNILIPEYSAYCFQAHTVRRELIRRGQGAVRANIGQKDLSKIPMVIPPINEQKAIASLLEKWDTTIEKTEALIEAKEKRFKWLLKTLISDQQDNPEWQQVKLVDACEVIVSPVDKKTVDGELPVKLCNYTDVYYNNAIDSKINFMAATAKPREIEKFSLVTDDVIITKDSETPDDIGVPAYVKETVDDLLCGYHLTILRPKKQTIGKYVCYALTSPRVKHDFYRFANGITRFGLTTESYQKIKIPLPLLPTNKNGLPTYLIPPKQEVEFLKQLTEQYRTQKRGLMQKLLTGKWRIKNKNAR